MNDISSALLLLLAPFLLAYFSLVSLYLFCRLLVVWGVFLSLLFCVRLYLHIPSEHVSSVLPEPPLWCLDVGNTPFLLILGCFYHSFQFSYAPFHVSLLWFSLYSVFSASVTNLGVPRFPTLAFCLLSARVAILSYLSYCYFENLCLWINIIVLSDR